MRRRRCYCPSCRARDARDRAERSARFWQVVQPLEPQRRRLNLPAVPAWEGEPPELDPYKITRKGERA